MDIKDLLLLFGGSQVVLVALVGWLGKLWLSRIIEREKHSLQTQLEQAKGVYQLEMQSQIERIRADFSRHQAMLGGAIAAASSAGSSGQQYRLRALEKLWGAVRCQKTVVGAAMMWWDMIYPIEGPENLKRPAVRQMLSSITLKTITEGCKKQDEEADSLRPFLGEAIWGLYYGYRMLLGRAASQIVLALEHGKDPRPWYEEEDVKKLLESVLSSEELKKLGSRKFEKLTWVLSRFEDRILQHAAAIVSGETAAHQSYEQSRKILEAAEEIQLSNAQRQLSRA